MIIQGKIIWTHASLPNIKGRFFHREVWPAEWQRDYWRKRLGLKLEGCYSSVRAEVLENLPRLLKRKCWSETERWMLKSMKLGDAKLPAWAKEIIEQTEKRHEELMGKAAKALKGGE